jgi:hypothetical protein
MEEEHAKLLLAPLLGACSNVTQDIWLFTVCIDGYIKQEIHPS